MSSCHHHLSVTFPQDTYKVLFCIGREKKINVWTEPTMKHQLTITNRLATKLTVKLVEKDVEKLEPSSIVGVVETVWSL